MGKMENLAEHSRREFLKVSLAAGGGMLLAFQAGGAWAQGAPAAKYVLRPEAFIRIDPNGHVALIIPQEEMGQGVYTSLSQLLADELDVGLDRVTPEPAPPSDTIYGSPMGGGQGTGGSTSIRAFYTALRQVGASARAMLVAAAAAEWHVDPATLAHRKWRSDRRCAQSPQAWLWRAGGGGGEIARAAELEPEGRQGFQADRQVGEASRYARQGQWQAQYGIDVRMPGLKVATLMASPVVGGKVASVDQAAALKDAGVRQVVVLDDLVAVVGDHFWAAQGKVSIALAPRWDGGPNGTRGFRTRSWRSWPPPPKRASSPRRKAMPTRGCPRTSVSMPSIKCRSCRIADGAA